jgi:hypothetical protein
MSHFQISMVNFQPAIEGRSAPLMLEIEFQNTVNRHARVLNYQLEIWQNRDFIGALVPDLLNVPNSPHKLVARFQPQQKATLRFLWHYKATDLQRIEDVRNGGPLFLSLRGQILVAATWPHPAEELDWEMPHSPLGQWPYQLPISQPQWVSFLDKVQFRHILLQEMEWPAFPPAWERADSCLKEAWNHYRNAHYEEGMLSCRRALECLGISIVGDPKAKREAVLVQLFPNAPPEKRERIEKLWEALQNLLNLAVHNRGQPMQWNAYDSEVCLLCTHSLLAYLAGL